MMERPPAVPVHTNSRVHKATFILYPRSRWMHRPLILWKCTSRDISDFPLDYALYSRVCEYYLNNIERCSPLPELLLKIIYKPCFIRTHTLFTVELASLHSVVAILLYLTCVEVFSTLPRFCLLKTVDSFAIIFVYHTAL